MYKKGYMTISDQNISSTYIQSVQENLLNFNTNQKQPPLQITYTHHATQVDKWDYKCPNGGNITSR